MKDHLTKDHFTITIIIVMLFGMLLSVGADGEALTSKIHVEKSLVGNIFELHLQADVIPPPHKVTLYHTKLAGINHEAWMDVIFGEFKDRVTHIFAYRSWDAYKPEAYVFDKDAEFAYEFEGMAKDLWAWYRSSSGYIQIFFDSVERDVDWYNAAEYQQADGTAITVEEAISLSDGIIEKLGLKDLKLNTVYTMPKSLHPDMSIANSMYNGYYFIEYIRMVNGIPLAIDMPLLLNGDPSREVIMFPKDGVYVGVDNDGVFEITGYYREEIPIGSEDISVTLDEAIDILGEVIDYAQINPLYDFDSNTQNNIFTIDEIDLCYINVQKESFTSFDMQVNTALRPVWRFASGINHQDTINYVIFIDAITGEVYLV